ncbi:DUF6538 domain-containing protein [Aliiroseovarius sp. PrR006]|uniref:DUF6538 domain-containing protein n=1 Tax=Aliiroseovarius sp. PrR006 TaxID=2706883 RepID=UPI00351A8824
MRIVLERKYLKPPTETANAKYRRRVPAELREVFGNAAIEWSLKSKDPEIYLKEYDIAHLRFESQAARKQKVPREHIGAT